MKQIVYINVDAPREVACLCFNFLSCPHLVSCWYHDTVQEQHLHSSQMELNWKVPSKLMYQFHVLVYS